METNLLHIIIFYTWNEGKNIQLIKILKYIAKIGLFDTYDFAEDVYSK